MSLVTEIAEGLAAAVRQKRVHVENRISGDAAVLAERFLIRQALRNLLENAVQFSPDGGAVVVTSEPWPAATAATAGTSLHLLFMHLPLPSPLPSPLPLPVLLPPLAPDCLEVAPHDVGWGAQ